MGITIGYEGRRDSDKKRGILNRPDNPTITIRPAVDEDLADYRELRLEALQSHPEAFSSDYATQMAYPIEWWQQRLRTSIAGEDSQQIFALDGQKLVGMCGVYLGSSLKTRHNAWIVGVYVRPAWRGLAIAGQMVNRCLQWAAGKGATIAKLGVAAKNIAAITSYQRSGFSVYGLEPQAIRVNGDDIDELLMSRSLLDLGGGDKQDVKKK